MQLFGKTGKFFYKIVRGIDHREIRANREIKSISAEDTFSFDLGKGEELNEWLVQIAKSAFKRSNHYQIYWRTLTFKTKFEDFKQITRSISMPNVINDVEQVIDISQMLLANVDLGVKKVRLLGVGFSNFGEIKIRDHFDGYQQTLFPNS